MAAELYARAGELHRLNQELREARTRERQVAVTLQEAMLYVPDLDRHKDNIAVRYLPATASLNVCGDWYDVVDLPPDRYAAAVGDVVGHGLHAADQAERDRPPGAGGRRDSRGEGPPLTLPAPGKPPDARVSLPPTAWRGPRRRPCCRPYVGARGSRPPCCGWGLPGQLRRGRAEPDAVAHPVPGRDRCRGRKRSIPSGAAV